MLCFCLNVNSRYTGWSVAHPSRICMRKYCLKCNKIRIQIYCSLQSRKEENNRCRAEMLQTKEQHKITHERDLTLLGSSGFSHNTHQFFMALSPNSSHRLFFVCWCFVLFASTFWRKGALLISLRLSVASASFSLLRFQIPTMCYPEFITRTNNHIIFSGFIDG